MTLVLIPYTEKVVGDYLRSCEELNDLIEERVFTEVPATPIWPLVKLTQVNETTITHDPLHFVAVRIQVDTFGSNVGEPGLPGRTAKRAVYEISETVRQLLIAAPRATHDGAVITAVRFLTGPMYMPDGTFNPARPRRFFDVNVYLHAAVSVGS